MVSQIHSLNNKEDKSKNRIYLLFGQMLFEYGLAVVIFLLYVTNIAQTYLYSMITNDSHWAWASFMMAFVLSVLFFPGAIAMALLSDDDDFKLSNIRKYWSPILFKILGTFLMIIIFLFCLSAFFLLFVKLFQSNWWLPILAINTGIILLHNKLIRSTFYKKNILDKSKLNNVLDNILEKTSFYFANVYDSSKADIPLAVSGKSLLIHSKLAEIMSDDELEASIMHEIGHVKRYDHYLRSAIGITFMIASWFFILWVAGTLFNVSWIYNTDIVIWIPLILAVRKIFGFFTGHILNAICRKQEYKADKFSVKNASNPQASISGLLKIHSFLGSKTPTENSSMFLWTDHPSTERRIRRMEKMINQ